MCVTIVGLLKVGHSAAKIHTLLKLLKVCNVERRLLQCSFNDYCPTIIIEHYFYVSYGAVAQWLMQKQFPTLRRCGILVKASPDRCLKTGTDAFRLAFVVRLVVAYSSKCDYIHWCIHQTRRSHMCHDQQLFWQASVNGQGC